MKRFYPGLHNIADVKNLPRAFVSIKRLTYKCPRSGVTKDRKSDFEVGDWILDSGAFTEITQHGNYRQSVATYARQIARWSRCGNLVAAVTQDYMCEPEMFEWIAEDPESGEIRTEKEREELAWQLGEPAGTSAAVHQLWTVDRYLSLVAAVRALGCDTYIMPTLQGYEPAEYVECLRMYEAAGALPHGALCGVGSVCKRNSKPAAIREVLAAIRQARPDLRLHGFGLKVTALEDSEIRDALESSDSMAWSLAARYEGRDGNDWREAKAYADRVEALLN